MNELVFERRQIQTNKQFQCTIKEDNSDKAPLPGPQSIAELNLSKLSDTVSTTVKGLTWLFYCLYDEMFRKIL